MWAYVCALAQACVGFTCAGLIALLSAQHSMGYIIDMAAANR